MALAKRLALILLPIVAMLCLSTPALALPSVQLWESYTTGADASYEVYGDVWLGQTFNVTPESHSVSEVRIQAYRVGEPGTVTVSIRAVDSGTGLPTGLDLTSGTFNGDTITTTNTGAWYGVTLTETSLDVATQYAIIVRAEAGVETTNSLFVRLDESSPAYTGGEVVTSSNGGLSWTDVSGSDAMFEVRGKALLSVEHAAVFRNYVAAGDMLFVVSYYNTYVPQYPTEDSNHSFVIQLRSTDGTTIIAQTTCRAWGYKPAAIYLNADSAAALTSGTLYRLYLYGDLTEEPSEYYTLTNSDWRGDNLALLDTWVLTTAREIADYYITDLTTFTLSGVEVLNIEGGVIFAVGIPGLQYVRPDLFEIIPEVPGYEEETWTGAFDSDTTWTAQVGTTIAATFTNLGTVFGISGRWAGAFLMVLGYLALVLAVLSRGGDGAVAAILAIPVIVLGTWLRLFDAAFIATIASIGILMLGYRFWLART